MRFFGNNNEKKLFDAIEDGNVLKVKSILKINDNKKINVNKKIKNGEYPLLKAIKDKNIELIKLLIEYANQNNIVLELNEKDENENYPLLLAIIKNNFDIVKLLMEYANQHNIVLEFNEKNMNGNYPLLLAIIKNNFDIVKLLKEYANQHNIVLELNEKDKNGSYPLLWAVHNDSIKIVKLLMKYANKQNILLELNEKDNEGDNPLSLAISKSNIDLQLNDINKENKTYYWAMDNNNNEMAKLLIEYAREHNIISELLIENAHNHNISLEYNKNDYEIRDIIKNNSEIKKLLDYEKGKNIRLDRERLENERKKREKLERERLERERLERERQENIRMEREILEKERLERERMERERLERERMERERLERERMERERLERERMERERLERERMERERLERERMERERLEGERLKNERKKNRNDGKHPKTPTLVIAINNFEGQEYDHLDIKKDEFLMVTDWNCGEEGWVCGYRKDNEKEKGIFPKVFVKIYKNEDKEKGGLINEITPEYRIKYENKINQLRSLNEMKVISTDINIKIHRNNLFNDAFNAIMSKTPQELKKRLRIEYENERGIDAGGLLRDFFYQISKEIGNPNYSLFQYSHDNSYELEINPNSGMVDPYHLKYFRFIGRMIGLSIFHKQYLSVCFTLLFYKKLLNIPLEISDLEYVDPQMFRNLQQLKDNDGAENLYLTFEMEMEDCFGNHKTIELKPNGGNIDVTDANKNEYIDLVIKNKLNNTNDKEQLNALKQGFYEIIPQNINTIIDEIDLKFLISGINELDVEDWENNTSYEGYNKNDITIKLFWKCVKKFSNENRTKLLIFATGNSQVPITGFKDLQGSGGRIQRFKLKKVGTEDDLPISHTCFNRIDLPPYTSAYVLKRKLLQAISEGIGGFSME